MNKQFSDIPGYDTWASVELLSKGWSTDKKYIVKTKAGEKLLLRIADGETFEQKKKEYDIICKYVKLGFEMSKPIAFGLCNNGKHTYMLLTWVEGEDLEEALPKLSQEEQYELGRSAGRILRKIHSIPVETCDVPEQTKKVKKLLQLERYEQSVVRIANDETAVKYVKDNIDKIWLEQPVYLHGDFHPGNLILTPQKALGVIDFNRWEVGDPYEEFYKLESFGVEISVPYCIGQIDAYFDDEVPQQFWETLAVYVAHASLFSIKWAEKFGQKEIDGMVRRCLAAMEHYDRFKSVVPSWYVQRKSNIKLKQLQNTQYEVFLSELAIGTITLSRNSFHAGSLYLHLDLNTYDVNLSADIFNQLWKEQESENRFQIMCDSSETEFVGFIERAGFICKRRCFECEVAENEWRQETEFPAEIRQYETGSMEYEKACELLYHQYVIKHEEINPLTASYCDFTETLPKQIYAEISGNQIQNFAFVEDNEIAYVGSVNKETYSDFISSVVKQLFSKYDTICFEADDTDPEAMQLKELFETEDEESYNTYILERTEQ